MLLPSRLLPSSLAALGAVSLLVCPTAARADPLEKVAFSPGLTFSASFGQKLAFGLGFDVRVTALLTGRQTLDGCSPNVTARSGIGPYAQITWLNFSALRVGTGIHGGGEVYNHALAVDGEAGWTYHSRYDDAHPGEHGLQLGLLGLGSGPVQVPTAEIHVRGILPVGSPFFSPEMMAGVGARWPPVFGFSDTSVCVAE